MSSVLKSPKRTKIAAPEPELEKIEIVEEEAEEAKRKERKKLLTGGYRSTRLSGIQSRIMAAIKKRLGE